MGSVGAEIMGVARPEVVGGNGLEVMVLAGPELLGLFGPGVSGLVTWCKGLLGLDNG